MKMKSRKFPPTSLHHNLINRRREPRFRLPCPRAEAPRLPTSFMLPQKKRLSQEFGRRRIASAPTREKAAVDEETGEAVAGADVAASACRNPSLPGQLRSRQAPIIRSKRIIPNEQIVLSEASVPVEASALSEATALNTVRRRATNRSCCPESRFQNISAWRRLSRARDRGRPRRILTHRLRLPPLFPRMSRYSRSRKRSSHRRLANLLTVQFETKQGEQPRTLKSDLPSGIANKSVCTK